MSDDESIERVFVVKRQIHQAAEMSVGHREPFEVISQHLLRKESRERPADIEFFQTDLDRDFPRCRRADQLAIRRIADHVPGVEVNWGSSHQNQRTACVSNLTAESFHVLREILERGVEIGRHPERSVLRRTRLTRPTRPRRPGDDGHRFAISRENEFITRNHSGHQFRKLWQGGGHRK